MSHMFISAPSDEEDSPAPESPPRQSKSSIPALVGTPSTIASSLASDDIVSPPTQSGSKRLLDPSPKGNSSLKKPAIEGFPIGQSLGPPIPGLTNAAIAANTKNDFDYDPEDPPPILFPWGDGRFIHRRAVTIAEEKNRDNPSTLEECIDIVLSVISQQDMKIHLAIISPMEDSNERKVLLRDKLKKAVKQKFYSSVSFESLIEDVAKISPTHPTPEAPKSSKMGESLLGKGPTFSDIIDNYVNNRGDKVRIMYSDGRPQEDFDLEKSTDQKLLALKLKNDGMHIKEWVQSNTLTCDRNLALAVDIAEDEKASSTPVSVAVSSSTGHVGTAAYAPGFNPVPSVGAGGVAASSSAGADVGSNVEGKNETSVIQAITDGGGAPLWKPSKGGFKKAMKAQVPTIGNHFHVSNAISNSMSKLLWYSVIMEYPPQVWFLKAGFIAARFIQYATDVGIDTQVWMSSWNDVSIRNAPYGENEYKRGRSKNGMKGRTINRIGFYFSIQENEKQLFSQKFYAIISKLNMLFHPQTDPGGSCLEYLKEHAAGIVDHFRKTLQTDSEIEKYLGDNLVSVFKDRSYSASYQNSLDRFMMDSDIKTFLETAGISNWEGISDLSLVFKMYPKKQLPDWNEIAVKSYQD